MNLYHDMLFVEYCELDVLSVPADACRLRILLERADSAEWQNEERIDKIGHLRAKNGWPRRASGVGRLVGL